MLMLRRRFPLLLNGGVFVKKTKKLALSALFSALGTVILLIGAIFELFDITAVAVASMLVIVSVIEIGGYYPYLIWLTTSVLAFIFCQNDLFAVVLYFLFGGPYPILKAMFERFHSAFVRWILKFSFFNTVLTLVILICSYVLHLPDNDIGFSVVVYAASNGAFFIYDIALNQMIPLYIHKLRPKLGLKSLFK